MRKAIAVSVVSFLFCAFALISSAVSAHALNGQNVLFSITATDGPDAIPYSIAVIKCFVDPQSWIDNNFSDDQSMPIHIISDSVRDLVVRNKTAIAFKTWEHENYVQNLLIDEGGYFLLCTTPHGAFNPDGNRIFQHFLRITIPNSGSTLEDENDKLEFIRNSSETEKIPLNVGTLSAASSFGTKVGSYNGVDAFSNGSVGYNSKTYNTYNGYRTGLKWQCVEYVARYFKAKFNKGITGGNANTYYSNASSKGLNRAVNGSTNKPRPGNLICSAGGAYGHVAIIREVGSDYVKVIQQNWSENSSDNSKKLSMTCKNGKYTISAFGSGYSVQGWCWPR